MKYRPLNLQTGKDFLMKEAQCSCEKPQVLKVWNYETGKREERLVPCGYCNFCQYQKQTNWVKRMELESSPLLNKHVYFFDLTYDKEYLAKDRAMARELYSVKVDGDYVPLLLCRKHLQLFFARLRKYSQKKFTYYACGEYGETYSRPHFHVILWSNDEFGLSDIERAWSKKGKLIGRIDFNDLVLNGTLSNLRSDSPKSEYSSGYAFKYVAKYINKMNSNTMLDRMYTKDLIYQAYKNYRIKNKEFSQPLNRDMTHKDRVRTMVVKVNQMIDKNKQEFTDEFGRVKAQLPERVEIKYCYKDEKAFFKQFLPYTVCSKNPGIGVRGYEGLVQEQSDVFKKHYDQFTGKQIVLSKSFKQKVLQQELDIIPCTGLDYRCAVEDLKELPQLFKDIRDYENKVIDQNAFRYPDNGILFFSRKGRCFYNLRIEQGRFIARQYDFQSGDKLGEFTGEQFIGKFDGWLERYLKLKKYWSKEVLEWLESKDKYIEGVKKSMFNTEEEFNVFVDRNVQDYKYDWYRRQKNWEFKHSKLF